MAQRDREKARRTGSPRSADSAAGLAEAVQRLEARAQTLERERDELKAELVHARARLAMFEQSRAEVVNRIDWVIDSLHNVIDKTS